MKTFRAKTGPFSQQPYFEPGEIELMCVEELQKVQLYPSDPEPIRIDRFIEKRFKIQPTYEDLPNGLLGFTLFSDKPGGGRNRRGARPRRGGHGLCGTPPADDARA